VKTDTLQVNSFYWRTTFILRQLIRILWPKFTT